MRKSFFQKAMIYAVLALISGVFYREFTKSIGFTGRSHLSMMHGHYFVMGSFMFLFLFLLLKDFDHASSGFRRIVRIYELGLNMSVLSFLVLGLQDTGVFSPDRAERIAVTVFTGIGHIILTLALCVIFWRIYHLNFKAECVEKQ